MGRLVTRAIERFIGMVETVAGLILAAVTVLIVVSAVGRYLFASPIPDSFDISRLLVGAAIMWGFASLGYRGSHIKVEILAETLPPAARRLVNAFAWTVLLFFVILLAWKMFERVESAYASGEATFDLRIVTWPLMALIWAGAAASVVTVAARLFLVVTGRGELEASERIDADEAERRA
jgi:TRAP-type C4-dicarboxylate transport system permease small subunit